MTLRGILIIVVGLSACGSHPVRVEGRYIRHSQHVFGSEHDTLWIVPEAIPGRFRVTRHWTYRRVRDGMSLPTEHRIQHMDLEAELTGDRLHDQRQDIFYTWSKRGDTLQVGSIQYIRQ